MLSDSYLSVIEAIRFSCAAQKVSPEIVWLNTKQFEGSAGKKNLSILNTYDALIVPGGFGSRGVDEKIAVIRHAREKKIPLLGICYGMQLMVIEYMRSVVGKRSAHTTEIDPKTNYPVIAIMDDQKSKIQKKEYGGSMRLGGYRARFKKNTFVHTLYGCSTAVERHRHRYEVNMRTSMT